MRYPVVLCPFLSRSRMTSDRILGVNESRLKTFFRVLAIALGSAETISARNSIGPDSRSYLEIAHAYLRHDWAMAVNAYWSPLYSWLEAAVLAVTHPSGAGSTQRSTP
jgi:hypothetical protein